MEMEYLRNEPVVKLEEIRSETGPSNTEAERI